MGRVPFFFFCSVCKHEVRVANDGHFRHKHFFDKRECNRHDCEGSQTVLTIWCPDMSDWREKRLKELKDGVLSA